MPSDPPRIIFVFLFASNLTLPEKKTLQKCQNLVLKSSEYTFLTRTHFLKRAYLRSFSGLTSLHSGNIQSNSKLHLPTKIFWIRPWKQPPKHKFSTSFKSFARI